MYIQLYMCIRIIGGIVLYIIGPTARWCPMSHHFLTIVTGSDIHRPYSIHVGCRLFLMNLVNVHGRRLKGANLRWGTAHASVPQYFEK